ncbi:MAG: TRAP transporter small permease [Rhizobiaceae bacterium]|nr:TRAP transporter small permease [Rhizobiaceae bacterium]
MSDTNNTKRAKSFGFARSIIEGWAMLGGILLLAVVAMNVYSVIGTVVWKPFAGDFEMTQVGLAIAVFAFLPYCQLTRSNVTADIFTARAPDRLVAVFTFVAALVALAFSLLLAWRMYYGMLDQKEYEYTTIVLRFPHWIAYIPILFSLFLLSIAAFITGTETFSEIRKANNNG